MGCDREIERAQRVRGSQSAKEGRRTEKTARRKEPLGEKRHTRNHKQRERDQHRQKQRDTDTRTNARRGRKNE